jgi:3-deoxy-D-manno-octulosonate 8-phosphate phosphatase (KDO 8-P phosphatase)
MNVLERFGPIRTMVFDVDGVLTDGTLLLTEDDGMLRTMNIKDGYALQLAVKKGYDVWIISGAKSPAVKKRLEKLGVKEVHIGIDSKRELLEEISTRTNAGYDSMLYMGDDIPDYACMKKVGLACCPQDAVTEIKGVAHYVSPYPGGKGCVRDVIEKVLKLNGHWDLPV